MTPTHVMAVPWIPERARRAVALAREVDAEITWDQTRNALDTWRSMLAAVDPERGSLHLEDDVVLADRWRERVEQVIAEHPDDVVQFFTMRKIDEARGPGWRAARSFLMNQCYYLPPGAAASLHAYTEGWAERVPEHPTGYDIAMGYWLRDNGRRYWQHVPSLVQHEAWRSEINPRRPRNRQSRTFG